MSRRNDLRIGRGLWFKVVFGAGLLFLLTPLFLLILFSFNSSKSVTQWGGFSLAWYGKAFRDETMWSTVRNSLAVAFLSTLVSTVLGTMAALALGRRRFRGRAFLLGLVHLPIILPEIVLGVALLILFTVARMPLGMLSVVCAHVTLCLPFVIIVVLASVRNFDADIEHAALDLGARPLRAFFDVVLPNISSGIVSAALFAFTLSIDDFVVTFFTTGPGFTTFPLKVYSMLKFGINPSINAISTLLIVFAAAAVAGAGLLTLRREKLEGKLRWIVGGLLAVTLGLAAFFHFSVPHHKVLHFAIYPEYLEESLLEDFRKETGIEVSVDYFNDANELLTKLNAGACSYDLMIVTDSYVDIFRRMGYLRPFDFRNMPNVRHVDAAFRTLYFDPSGRYYVPYAYCSTGIAYNAEKVRGPVDSWKALWDPAYRERVTVINDARSAFSIAFLRLGYSINDTDRAHLARAKALLFDQKKVLRKYESNLFKDMLRSGEIWLAHGWSGEALRLARENPKFKYALPREGCVMSIDNFCIPTGAANVREAERFVDFLVRPENAARNMESICYAMPNEAGRRLLPPDYRDSPILFPPPEAMKGFQLYRDLGPYLVEISNAWTELKGK